jgi:VWFA-related protein
MTLWRVLGVIVVAAALTVRTTATARAVSGTVEIDAVAVDAYGQTVRGLLKDDFRVREDDRPVQIDTLTEVSALGSGGREDARTIVLMLDDSDVPPELTSMVQDIARMFIARKGSADSLNVVRLNHRSEEAIGGESVALSRIADYRAGMIPFFGRETLETALTKVAKVSRQLGAVEHRRKAIVCIGSPRTFDIAEPRDHRNSLLWPSWVAAMTSASRANASVYVVDPAGVTGQIKLSGSYGLVAHTGGDTLYNSRSFEAMVERIWREAGHYYLLGYTPSVSSRELHKVDVTVTRSGTRVRARSTRG